MASFFRFRVFGRVQGVGFRPRIYVEAKKRALSGFVRNAGSHAEIVAN
ncbi:MAG: acylphosphatase, partial [Candidatus Aenigmarchaeota archaeon]|nr:acylphosphatase [Candidatus Aenigmarchaeota archaeon]